MLLMAPILTLRPPTAFLGVRGHPRTKLSRFGFLELDDTDRVNGVCPGPVRTPWGTDEGGAADIRAAATGSDRESVMTTVAPEMMQLVTGRLADPKEIAFAVAFLASPPSVSTTGAEFVVDSGLETS
jgi:NAD(P)-dependent dehydrogenase (short-subunit alcohol dehydrogenase family)